MKKLNSVKRNGLLILLGIFLSRLLFSQWDAFEKFVAGLF